MSFRSETVEFLSPGSDLVSLAKRYVPSGAAFATNGLTFVFGHNVTSHKEMWEPVIDELFGLCSSTTDNHFRIREVWSLEWQSHGQSAILNEEKLARRDAVSTFEYADVLRLFVSSEHLIGHRVVPVGFSASSAAWALAMLKMESLPFTAVILIEPTIAIPPMLPNDPRAARGVANRKAVLSRKDKWSNMEEASEYMRKRYPWKFWDKKMFDLYMKYGLREKSADGQRFVTFTCSLAQEVIAYDADSHFAAAPGLSKACSKVKVHAIFGERPELVTLEERKTMCDATEGRGMTSMSIVPRAGHLVVCEKPSDVAHRIFGIMSTTEAHYRKANL